jgi:hypothetical protein
VRILLGWFPRIHEDELLYSVIARYYKQSPHLSVRETLYDIFKDSRAVLTPDFPSNLDVLHNQLRLFCFFPLEDFICKHTPFLYYTNFLEITQRKEVIKEIINPKQRNVQMLIGMVASKIKQSRFFKYCPHCIEADELLNGESYWRMSHQLPGVFVCSTHRAILHYSSAIFRYDNSTLFIPDSLTCKPPLDNKCITDDLSISELNLLIRIAIESTYLLTCKLNFSMSSITNIYKELLKENGYLTTSGNVKQIELYFDFISFYGMKILGALQSIPTSEESSCWLRSITRKHRKSFHPLRHILLLIFLGKGISILNDTINYYGPFGKGPFPCLNRASDHFKNLVVTQLGIKRCTDTGRPIGVFTCECGFQYTRLGPDKLEEDKFTYRFVRSYGDVWFKKLLEYVDEENYSFRKTAQLLEVDVGTVIKYYKRSKEENLDGSELKNTSLEDIYRSIWAKSQEENPIFSKTELRRLNPNVYAWLYRNDRDWLNENSPKKQSNPNKNYRVDWNKRDLETLTEIKKLMLTINYRSRPKRITKRYLAVAIGKLSIIEKHLDKLPVTKLFIESNVESHEKYRERLSNWREESIQ